MCLALLQPCTDHFLSVALRLTRRLVLYDWPCLNLLRGDRVLIPVPSDCKSGLIQPFDLSSHTVYFNGCPYIFLIYYYITKYFCAPYFYDLSAFVGCWSSVYIRRIFYKFLNVCPFDYTTFAVSGRLSARKPV